MRLLCSKRRCECKGEDAPGDGYVVTEASGMWALAPLDTQAPSLNVLFKLVEPLHDSRIGFVPSLQRGKTLVGASAIDV